MADRTMTVLLVDDEQLMLNEMKTQVDWKSYGFRVVAAAHNGKRALEYYKRYHPDLVITDIVMPIMDGLELTRQIRMLSEKTYILIITAYDEFEYAKKALQSGVADYILKNELIEETFGNKLKEIREKLEKDTDLARRVSHMEIQALFNTPPSGIGSSDNIPQNLSDVRYTFYVISEQQPLKRSAVRYKNNINRSRKHEKPFEELKISDQPPAFVISVAQYIILAFRAEKTISSSERRIHSAARGLLQKIGIDNTFVFYYPQPLKLSEFHHIFYACSHIMDFLSHFGQDRYADMRILENLTITEIQNSIQYPPLDDPDKSTIAAWESDLQAYLDRLFMHHDFSGVDNFFKGFCYYCESALGNNKIFEDEIYVKNEKELYAWFLAQWERCVELKNLSRKSSYSPIVAETIELIKKKYGEPEMSIELLSKNIGMSPGRLAQRFRQETGETINEYLTDVRMEAAEFFLKNTNDKVYDIAEKIGYSSPQYFSQIFYRRTGLKPLDLRRREAGNDKKDRQKNN